MNGDARPAALQAFLDAAREGYLAAGIDDQTRACIHRVFHALRTIHPISSKKAARVPSSKHLSGALEPARRIGGVLEAVADCISKLDPLLTWRTGRSPDETSSANYAEEHANSMIVGPGGLENRSDIWIGLSMLGPNVRYPDHTHPPEEAYLVLTDGQFRQGEGKWFTPGVGGTLYNEPGILHAMRSSETEPFLALWCLPIDVAKKTEEC
jgi:quercetin dioxygenase-like cupin family protein